MLGRKGRGPTETMKDSIDKLLLLLGPRAMENNGYRGQVI